MPQIRILADDLINKIAAGEVIERPASVVKELVENALDAGARRIVVEVEGGGKRLIRVGDDGCGMTRDDALLAVERHATSKLHTQQDLNAIATLGFRGEALPSIASVSKFKLETRPADAGSGTRIEIDNGKMRDVKDAGCPPGTQIEVRGLFSRLPARRKFLRSDTTELGHVATLVTNYSLAHPETGFVLKSGSHTVLDAPPVRSLQERVYQVLGKETAGSLSDLGEVRGEVPASASGAWFQVESSEEVQPRTITVRGFTSKPEVQRSSAKSIYIFINRRFVRDRILLNAIREAYRHMLPARAYPSVLLFLDVPHQEVDVNVHPQKIEVRFRHQSFVHDFVEEAVRKGISTGLPVTPQGREVYRGTERTRIDPAPVPDDEDWPEGGGSRSEGPMPFSIESPDAPGFPDATTASGQGLAFGPSAASVEGAVHPAGPPDTMPLRAHLAGMRPLGQMNDSFIIAVNEAGLWVVDQHVAHERVLFEGHMRSLAGGRVESQGLLHPVVVELTPNQRVVWDDLEAELTANGFEMDAMGQNSVAIKAVPAAVAAGDVDRLLFEILGTVEREARNLSMKALQLKVAATIACHAAVKVNMPLTQDKMQWLLDQLSRTENPSTCPHGRPIVLRYSIRDILKSFKRI